MPLVSVIIPAYNSGPYLDEAVQSVIAQTFTDWECIVVDDGSTEDLSRVEKVDARVRLIRQENRGPSSARNSGILESSGELVAFLDADDLWRPSKLDLQLRALAGCPGAGYCHTGFDYLSQDGTSTWAGWDGRPTPSPVEAARNVGGILFSTGVVRRRCLATAGLFDPLLRGAEDVDFLLRLSRVFPIIAVPDRVYLYRQHGSNATRNYRAMRAATAEVFRRHCHAARIRGDLEIRAALAGCARDFRGVFGSQAYDAARKGLRGGNMAAFFAHLGRALAWNPRYTGTSLARFPVDALKKRLGREIPGGQPK